MLNLLAQAAPDENISILSVMVWPIAMTLLGGLIFYFGWWYENRMTKAPWKWIAFAPLAYGLFVGWGYMSSIMDPLYQAAMPGLGRKMVVAHYAAFILPALGAIGVVLFHFFNHKLNIAVDD
jgi:hypothetical protein